MYIAKIDIHDRSNDTYIIFKDEKFDTLLCFNEIIMCPSDENIHEYFNKPPIEMTFNDNFFDSKPYDFIFMENVEEIKHHFVEFLV